AHLAPRERVDVGGGPGARDAARAALAVAARPQRGGRPRHRRRGGGGSPPAVGAAGAAHGGTGGAGVVDERARPGRAARPAGLRGRAAALRPRGRRHGGVLPAKPGPGGGARAWSVSGLDPAEPLGRRVSVAELRHFGGVFAYTAVYAPRSLSQAIVHVWRRDGAVVDTVELSPVQGGRQEGFRTFSHKTNFPADPAGRWSVDVMTSSGQLIGRLRFAVVE